MSLLDTYKQLPEPNGNLFHEGLKKGFALACQHFHNEGLCFSEDEEEQLNKDVETVVEKAKKEGHLP